MSYRIIRVIDLCKNKSKGGVVIVSVNCVYVIIGFTINV